MNRNSKYLFANKSPAWNWKSPIFPSLVKRQIILLARQSEPPLFPILMAIQIILSSYCYSCFPGSHLFFDKYSITRVLYRNLYYIVILMQTFFSFAIQIIITIYPLSQPRQYSHNSTQSFFFFYRMFVMVFFYFTIIEREFRYFPRLCFCSFNEKQ